MNYGNISTITFPSWTTIEQINNKEKEFGFLFTRKIAEGIDVRIECVNENIREKANPNIIRVSFALPDGTTVVSRNFLACKKGYYASLKQLIEWAEMFQNAFNCFLSCSDIA